MSNFNSQGRHRFDRGRFVRYQRFALTALLSVAFVMGAGCQMLQSRSAKKHEVAAVPVAVVPGDPVVTHQFTISPDNDVVGTLQVTRASAEDTLSDIARRFNLGFDELVRANPGVDPWLPGADREIFLPTQFVLPDAPREGLVINLPALRVFYFPKPRDGEPQKVITHPIGIGKVGWSTPEGSTKVTGKRKNPIWTPPASVRKEHKENGDPLPKQVPAGPDNPLGAFAMTLGWPTYLVHGTNKPYGVGMRSSHGCIRFYPEDIALLFDQIPIGTTVTVVNQPLLIGWHEGAIYVQSMPALEDDTRPTVDGTGTVLNSAISGKLWDKARSHSVAVNLETVTKLVGEKRGIATPVSKKEITPAQFLASAARVTNRLPAGATWDGKEELLVTAEEYEAVRDGKPMPKRPTTASTKTGKANGKPVGSR